MADLKSGPGVLNWTVYAGDSNREEFQYVTGGVPVDLTGATFRSQARKTAQDGTVAATALITPVDLTKGLFTIEWDGEALRALLGGKATWAGVWDFEVLLPSQALPVTKLKGKFSIEMDVTRA